MAKNSKYYSFKRMKIFFSSSSRYIVLGIILIGKLSAKELVDNNKNENYALLGLIGFNYTDRDIQIYSVDGTGGGNVRLSSFASGGGGVVCCTRLLRTEKQIIQVKVKWQFNGCTYLVKVADGRSDERRHWYYKEASVYVDLSNVKDAAHLETHFFPDGSVKVRVTEDISLPEIKLNGNRKEMSQFPRCKNNEKPDQF